MRQRGVIGIALSNRLRLLIVNEPATALDATVQAQLMDLLMDLKRRRASQYS